MRRRPTGPARSRRCRSANPDSSITALCLALSDDLLQAKVTIRDTLAQYLDAENYPEGNLSADPQQEKLKVFYIDAKSTGNQRGGGVYVVQSNGPSGLMIPTRQLHLLCTGVSVTNTASR